MTTTKFTKIITLLLTTTTPINFPSSQSIKDLEQCQKTTSEIKQIGMEVFTQKEMTKINNQAEHALEPILQLDTETRMKILKQLFLDILKT